MLLKEDDSGSEALDDEELAHRIAIEQSRVDTGGSSSSASSPVAYNALWPSTVACPATCLSIPVAGHATTFPLWPQLFPDNVGSSCPRQANG